MHNVSKFGTYRAPAIISRYFSAALGRPSYSPTKFPTPSATQTAHRPASSVAERSSTWATKAVLRYCCRQIFQPGIYQAMGISELAMNAQKRVKGCGKTGQNFTLYHVSLFDGTASPMSQGFKNLACGCCVSTFQKMTYGIVLCPTCAEQLGLAPLPSSRPKAPLAR